MTTSSTGAALVDGDAIDALVVTPSDTISAATRLHACRGIWVDVGGTVSLITEAAASQGEIKGPAVTAAKAVSFTLAAGQTLQLKIAYVLATGTAATGIKAFF